MAFDYIVKRGDTLSAIARAHQIQNWRVIYNHPENASFRARRPNPNLIHPGDLVRIPGALHLGETVIKVKAPAGATRGEPVVGGGEQRTPEDVKREAEQVLGRTIDSLPGDQRRLVLSILGLASKGKTALQLIGLLEGLVGSWLAPAAGIAGAPLIAIQGMLSWADALDRPYQMYSYRAVSYTITAWAFGRRRPVGSPGILRNYELTGSDYRMRELNGRWQSASLAAWSKLTTLANELMRSSQVPLELVQFAHRLGETDPGLLSRRYMEQFNHKFSGIALESWIQGYRGFTYPR